MFIDGIEKDEHIKNVLNKLIEINFVKTNFQNEITTRTINDECNLITIDKLILSSTTSRIITINDITKQSLNILCCLMCENDYSIIDIALAPFFNQKFFHSKATSSNSIFVEIFSETHKQLVMHFFFNWQS